MSEGAIDADSLAVSPDGKTLYAGSSVADTVSAFPRDPATGALGPAYCFGVQSFAGCSHSGARALRTTSGVAVGPDSKSVYATSITDRAVAELAHDDATGQLSQSAGTDGCISRDGSAFWPGHQSGIYCASMYSWGFQTPRNLAVAPDGKSVLVADSSAGLMDYDRTAGGLSDRVCYGPGVGCQLAHGVKAAWDVATTPDGKGVYVASASPGGVAAFDRDPATGSLVQSTFTSGNPPHASSGCINQDASDGCTQGRAVAGALGVVVSPDGQNVYVNGEASGGIAAFGRDAGTNQLHQLDGADGCISYNGSGGLCSEGKLMESIKDIAASPDGKNIYAVSQNNQAVLVFDRDTTPPPTPSCGGAPSGGGGGRRRDRLGQWHGHDRPQRRHPGRRRLARRRGHDRDLHRERAGRPAQARKARLDHHRHLRPQRHRGGNRDAHHRRGGQAGQEHQADRARRHERHGRRQRSGDGRAQAHASRRRRAAARDQAPPPLSRPRLDHRDSSRGRDLDGGRRRPQAQARKGRGQPP